MMCVLLALIAWYVFGVINIIGTQALSADPDFDFGHMRTMTLWVCYGLGPIVTTIALLFLVVRFPIKFGTRFGRTIGHKIRN